MDDGQAVLHGVHGEEEELAAITSNHNIAINALHHFRVLRGQLRRLTPQLRDAERLYVVVDARVGAPDSRERDPGQLAELLMLELFLGSRGCAVEIDLPDVELALEVHSHDPLLVRVRELSQQDEVDGLVRRRHLRRDGLFRRPVRVTRHIDVPAARDLARLQWRRPPLRLVRPRRARQLRQQAVEVDAEVEGTSAAGSATAVDGSRILLELLLGRHSLKDLHVAHVPYHEQVVVVQLEHLHHGHPIGVDRVH